MDIGDNDMDIGDDADVLLFARDVDVVVPFLSDVEDDKPRVATIPSIIMDGSAPRILARIRDVNFPVMLDSGAEVSVLPLELTQSFQPPIQIPANKCEVRTFGSANATLLGPVPLEVSFCGVKILHPFYLVDSSAPPIAGYDLMRAARMVIDVDNCLVWSRRVHASVHSNPNPPVSIPNTSVRACVSMVHPELSAPSVVDTPASAPALAAAHSATHFHQVESSTLPSSVISRQVSVVFRSPSCRASVLNPSAQPFRPRATLSSQDAPRPRADFPQQSCLLPVYPLVDSDDTLSRPLSSTGAVHSVTSPPSDTDIPAHLQELYDQTVDHAKLSSSHRQSLAALLRCNSDAFATGPLDLGFCAVLQHDIETGNAAPIKQPPRRPPLAARDAEDQIVNEMLETGVIEPSQSPWSSPVCMVKKKDNTYRFCIDYRRLNDVTKKDAFPVPDIKDALDSLYGAKYFATIDLLSGYWQLGLTERAKERTAFSTRRGLFQFTRMPFGLSNAPSTFCRLMQVIFKDMLYKQCLCYLDDIVVFASTPDQLLERLDAVLTRLRQNGLKAKPSKCVLFKSPIEFLGHLVSQGGIEPQPAKLDTIRNWPTPHCLRDVRAFFGLASYYRRFVRDFAAIAEPLSRLTRKNTSFTWTNETQESFDKVKRALLDAGALAYPNPDVPCILDTDASDVAIGAVLSQKIDGVERPISFFSRVLTGAQRNYCATRRELLAAVAAFQYFRHYLLGAHVILRTDHNSLTWLKNFKRPEGILARWIETLAEYDYSIEHRPGRLHSNADAISRQMCKQCLGKVSPVHWIDECERADDLVHPLSIHSIQVLPELSSSDISEMQAEDSEMGDAYRVLQNGLNPSPDELRAFPLESRHLLSLRPEIRLEDGVMVKVEDERTRLVVPVTLRQRLFTLTHAGPTAAHLGSRKTIQQLKNHYFWSGLSGDVNNWCRQCTQCAQSKGPPLRPHGHLQKVPVGAPMDLVTMDVLSGLPTSTDGSKYILVVVDAFTKWVEAYAIPDQEATTCMNAAYQGFFSRFGFPRQLHSDQGRNFEATLVKELCALAGIHKTRTTPYHPRSDGLSERANRTILQMLRTTTEDNPHDWPNKLHALLSAYRMTVHATTRTTPNFAMLGREVLLPCTLIARPPNDAIVSTAYVADFRDTLREAHDQIRESLRAAAKTEKRYFDQRVNYHKYTVGQLVWLYWPRPLIRTAYRKLAKLWTGPWEILAFTSPLVVQIRNIATKKRQTVHVDRLVPCASEHEADSSSEDQFPQTSQQSEHQTVSNNTEYNLTPLPPTTRVGRKIYKPLRYR